MTDAPLFTPEDVARLQRSARYLRHPDAGTIANAEAGGFEDIADRLQRWLDQQAQDDAFDATIQRSIDDGSFDRAFGPVLEHQKRPIFEHCQFEGDPPAGYPSWHHWAASPTKTGVTITLRYGGAYPG